MAIRKASLQTLSYICEEIEVKDLKQEDLELILSALVTNMNDDNSDTEVIQICIETMGHTID